MPFFGASRYALPALIAFAEQFLRTIDRLLRFVRVARGRQRVEAVQRDARTQQVRRSIVERVNGDQIAARDTVERLARAVQRG